MVAAAPHLDQSPFKSEHETIQDTGATRTLRRNVHPNPLPRLRQRPIRPVGRRLQGSSLGSLPRSSTRQERIQKYFREAAQRRFALGIVLPRRREDVSKTANPTLPPPGPVDTILHNEGGFRNAQEQELSAVSMDAAMVGGQHIKETPQLLVTKFHGPVKTMLDSHLSPRKGIQPDHTISENDRTSLPQGQMPLGNNEGHSNSNPEILVARVAQQPTEASTATVTKSGSEQEKITLQNINLPAASGGLLTNTERITGQGVSSRVRLRDDESGEQGGRKRISFPLRRRRLRIRRPNFGRQGRRLVALQNLPGEIQDRRLSGIHQRQSLSLSLEHTKDHSSSMNDPHSLPTVGGESTGRQQPHQTMAQAPPSYLPEIRQESDDFLTPHVQLQVSGDTRRTPAGPETPQGTVFELPKEDIQIELRQESLTHTLHKENVQPQDHHILTGSQHHSTHEEQQPAAETIPVTLPETTIPPMDALPQDLATTPSTSHQKPSVPSETIIPSSFDNSGRSAFGHSPDLQELLPKVNTLQRLSARQQEIARFRLSQRLQDSDQSVPRLRTSIRHRFSQSPQRTSQPQRLMPVRQPQTENFPIPQTHPEVASDFLRNDSSMPQSPHEPRLQSHSQAQLNEAAHQSEHVTQETGGLDLHFAPPRQITNNRFSDQSVDGDVTGAVKEPLLMSVALRVHRLGTRPSTSTTHGQQESQRMPAGSNKKGLQQHSELHDMHLPITFDMHSRNENTHSSFSTDHFPAIPQHLSPDTHEQQPAGTLLPIRHQHQHHQRASLSHPPLDNHHYNTQLTMSHDVTQVGDIHDPHLETYAPTQATPHTTHRDNPSNQVDAGHSLDERNKDKGMTTDDISFLEGVAVASLLSGDHMGLKHVSPPHDTKVTLTGDNGVFRPTNDGRLTSVSHTQTEGAQREQSKPHQNLQDFSPSTIPLHSAAGAAGAADAAGSAGAAGVSGARRARVNQALHLRQSGVADLASSSKPADTTTYKPDNGQSNAEAYISHLKKLESELERHVSHYKNRNLSFRKVTAIRQGDTESSIIGEQVQNNRQRGASVRESQTSRSNIENERRKFSNLKNDASRSRGSVQNIVANNEIKMTNQHTSLTDARDGQVYQFQSGRFRQAVAPREPTQETTSLAWPTSRVWRQQSQVRADGGRIRLREDDRTPLWNTRSGTLAAEVTRPHISQPQQPDSWHPQPPRQPPSPQGRVRVVQSSRDDKTTFVDSTAAPPAPTTLASPPLRAAARRGSVSSARVRQQFDTPDTSMARASLTSREGRQRQVQPPSRRLTNSHGHPAYTYQRVSVDGTSKDNLFRHEGEHYSFSGQSERLRQTQRTSSFHEGDAQTRASSSQGGTSRTSVAGFTQTVKNEAETNTPDQRLIHQHRGGKTLYWNRADNSYKSVAQRGSRKFVDTLRDRTDDMKNGALMRSLTALLRGEDFSSHWTNQNMPQQGFQRPQDLIIPETGESYYRIESRLHLKLLRVHVLF